MKKSTNKPSGTLAGKAPLLISRISIASALVLILLCCLPKMALGDTQLVTNGGFETGNFSGWTTSNAPAGSFLVVSGGNGHTGNYGALFGASQSYVDAISQTFSTVSGATYSLSFWLSNASGGSSLFQAVWNGGVVYNAGNTGFVFQQQTFSLVANSTSTTLGFQGRTAFGQYRLDDVSLLAKPGSFWRGTAGDGVWTSANWSLDSAGSTLAPLPPDATTDVAFSAAAAPGGIKYTTLGGDFNIKSLTVSDPSGISIGGANTLTVSGTSGTTGINVNSGAGFVLIGSNVNLAGSSQNIAVKNGAGMEIRGNVGGSIGLTKSGAGKLTLSGSNTYNGATTVSSGILQFTKEAALYNNTPASWTAQNLIVNSGATAAFNVGGSGEFTAENIQTLVGLGTGTGGFKNGSILALDTSNAPNYQNVNGVITDIGGGTFVYDHVIANPNGGANALGLIKLGAGTLNFYGNTNTYSGGTTVEAGAITFSHGANAGSGSYTIKGQATGVQANGGVLNFDGGSSAGSSSFTIEGSRINNFLGGAILANTGGGSVNFSDATTTADHGTFTANGAALSQAGGGRINLGASADHGTFTANAGTVLYGYGGEINIGASADHGTFTANGGGLSGGFGGTINIFSGGSADYGTFTINGGSSGYGASMNFLYSSTGGQARIILNGHRGALHIEDHAAGSVTVGSIEGDGSVQIGGNELIVGSNNLSTTFSGQIHDDNYTGGQGTFTKIGAGTLTISGSSDYHGATRINGGTLSVSKLANGGNSPTFEGTSLGVSSSDAANLVLNGGTLRYTGGATSTDRLFSIGTAGGTIDSSGSGPILFINEGSMGFNGQSGARTLTLTGATQGNLLLAAIGDNGGATSVLKTGAGSWFLGVHNTYTGTTTIQEGVLQVINGGDLGGGNVTNNSAILVNRTDSYTISSNISGSGSLLQIGTGKTTISSNNTYTGATTINSGEVVVNGSIAASSGVSVSAGAILSGHGTVSQIGGSGVVAPGNSPGILTATSVNPSGGLGFSFQFTQLGSPIYGNASASGNDVLHLKGGTPFTSALNGSNLITLDFTGQTLHVGDIYYGGFFTDTAIANSLVDGADFVYTGTNGLSIQFDGMTAVGSADFASGTVTNGEIMQFEVISGVPEPATGLAGIAAGAIALFSRQRRRRVA